MRRSVSDIFFCVESASSTSCESSSSFSRKCTSFVAMTRMPSRFPRSRTAFITSVWRLYSSWKSSTAEAGICFPSPSPFPGGCSITSSE